MSWRRSRSGGGSAATGGGTSATGGGTSATGGGTSATGGGSAATGGGSAATGGGSSTTDGGHFFSNCPTTGTGAIAPVGPCSFFTPAEAGANPAGVNADQDNYAIEPPVTPLGQLVVYLPASLAWPARQVPDPTTNFYNTAASLGFHSLALSYRNDSVLGISCKQNDGGVTESNACFDGTRKTIVTGVAAPGAPTTLANSIMLDEGIVARLDAALRYLIKNRPGAGWDQFLANPSAPTAEARIAWSKIIAAGHSQGGGHAAYLAKLFAISRVLQFSSTCDVVATGPAQWTSSTDTWATSPATRFEGLGNDKDSICPWHVAIWQNMGMATASQHDDAVNCKNASYAHECTVFCTENADKWKSMLQ